MEPLMTPLGSPPRPVALSHLRAANRTGAAAFVACMVVTVLAFALSARAGTLAWLVGQVLLALALVQWFALLHECGHDTLFRTRRLNAPLGHVAAFFSVIPFYCWKRIHGRHHKWTGWQDVDPTTASLVPRDLGRVERVLVNVCWKYWLPLFAILYRANNFWNVPRLWTLFPSARDRRLFAANIVLMVVAYGAVAYVVGPADVLRLAGLGVLLSLIAEDVLLLSQHTHIPQNVSHGEAVRPFPTIEQEVYTRSLRFPEWLSLLLLNIDAHELHHMYPFVPGYRLKAIPYETENAIGWWTWARRARQLPGEMFLFHNRLETGADL
jgi:omega-6 fatty acid desaturase (delta-12 desaturase)